MLQVCITCLQEITDLNFISLSDATSLTGSLKVRDVLSICVPELSLDLLADPIMCAACMTSLHLAYDFRCKCLSTKERLRSYLNELTPSQENNNVSENIFTDTNVDPTLLRVKSENPEWFETNQLEVWVKDEPHSSDDENINKEEQAAAATTTVNYYEQKSTTSNFIYSWNETENNNNKTVPPRLESHDTDSGWSSSNADSDMNSSGDPAEGCQLRKALEAPRKLFECDICKKTFDRSTLFHLHKKIHENKPFKCNLCKYSATLRLNLIRHMREHIETKPQTYNLCDCLLEHSVTDENGQ